MDLNRKNIIKIIFIVFVAVLIFVVIQNLDTVFDMLGKLFSILSPFIIGFCIAFIINVLMRFFENRVFLKLKKKKSKFWTRFSRPLCLLLSILLICAILTVFLLLIIPQIRESIVIIAEELPSRAKSLADSVRDFLLRYNISFDTIDKLQIDWDSISAGILNNFKAGGSTVINTTIDLTSGILKTLFNFILGFAFSIYLLMSKEKLAIQIKKVFYAMFKEETATDIVEVVALSNNIFSKFVIGQCAEALIIGVLCYIGMLIFRMPYAIMISSLVAVTALIPIFGAFIGTAVGALMILLVNPIQAVWFLLFITILQQLESNIIYPKVVGDSVGLPGIWVLFSVTVGASLFGITGMLISVPVSAVLYYLLREYINKKLKDKKVNKTLISQKEF
ncbi:MAG: AI-2E family transporter [Eubacteriales bacterium]